MQPQRNSPTQSQITDDILNGQLPPMVQIQYIVYGGQVNTGTMYGQQAMGGYGAPPTATPPYDAQPYNSPPYGAPPYNASPTATSPSSQIQPYRSQPLFQSYTEVETWFFGLDEKDPLTFDTRLHFLVLAIFAGNSLRFIEAVKKLLDSSLRVRMVQVVESNKRRRGRQRVEETPQTPPPIFQRNTSDILYNTSSRAETRRQGKGMVQVCEFIDARYQIHALHFLSTSPDLQLFRDEFRSWLEGICSAEDQVLINSQASLLTMTRIQAAIGLGEFAKNDYQHYYQTLIMPYATGWFKNGHTQQRIMVVGWLLYQLATDPRYTDNVFNMVREWASLNILGHMQRGITIQEMLDEMSLVYTATSIVTTLGMLDLQRTIPIITLVVKQFYLPKQSFLLYLSIEPLYRFAERATLLLATFSEWQQYPSSDAINSIRADLGIRFFLMLIGGAVKFQDNQPDNHQALDKANLEQLSGAIGDDESSEQSRKAAVRGIWDVILRGKESGMNHPEASLEILVKYTLRHPEGPIVDEMTDLLAQWITLGDQRPELGNYIYYVLREIKRYKYGYRVIMRLCQSRAFSNSHMAHHLFHAQ